MSITVDTVALKCYGSIPSCIDKQRIELAALYFIVPGFSTIYPCGRARVRSNIPIVL